MQRAAKMARVVAFGAVMIMIGSVTGAYASHQFSDVGPSSPIHGPVDHIARAGITAGYPDGTFRPGDFVTRGQMAAFMDRGLGRVAYDERELPAVEANDHEVVVTDVRISSGASGGSGGFVVLTSTFDMAPNGATPFSSYRTYWKLRDATVGTHGPLVNVPYSTDSQGGSLTWVAPINPGQTKVFELVGRVSTSPSPSFRMTGRLTAQYVPFGWNGGGQLDYDPIIIGGADGP